IVNADGRIVAVLLGRPDGDDWDDVVAEMARVMDGVRRRGVARGVFKSKLRRHRRGNFFKLADGYSLGGGQQVKPGNLAHSKEYRKLLQILRLNHSIRRIAGFQSSGLARYLPKLYAYYASVFKGLFERQPELEQIFSNSIFPSTTYNLGPDVFTAEHLDGHNTPYGMCGLTSGGKYDHKTGGHVYLKQLKLVLEFPSGSSALILSAACEHGNTPIQAGETRYSMTQYAAGELFRWVTYGYQTAKSLLAQVDGEAKKQLLDGEPGERAAWAIGLLSKADELEADRRAVFGKY
ncbi:hypothetical protein C8F04DRAFT_942252, partial [Mycena alexandri]